MFSTDQTNKIDELEHQQKLLLVSMTNLLKASGVIRKDIEMLDGPSALMFAEELTGHLKLGLTEIIQIKED